MLLAPTIAAACTATGARSASVATETAAGYPRSGGISHRFTETLLSLGLLPTDQWMPACAFMAPCSAERPLAVGCLHHHRRDTSLFSVQGPVSFYYKGLFPRLRFCLLLLVITFPAMLRPPVLHAGAASGLAVA